ncbi:MAG: hypothetical protein J5741_00135 [Bacteroidales bacterium]|nr:hypothetical protein [Bacteroidales bacterium]
MTDEKDDRDLSGDKTEQDPSKGYVNIVINKYEHLVAALSKPKTLVKTIIVISTIVMTIFVGIALIALMLRQYYPYNSVRSNKYGATIIKDEDTEIIYWLFNSADLWANSGIEVKEGDIISVRTSGAFNTAIHHLTDDAKNNKPQYRWISPTGGKQSDETRDLLRNKYRIAPNEEPNVILMQVVKEEISKHLSPLDPNNVKEYAPYFDGRSRSGQSPEIYVIGMEKENIKIHQDGILHFAVNDIALTDAIIDSMRGHENELKLDSTKISNNNKEPELDYYEKNNLVNAWFTDNVGSFLIVIERKRQ